MNTILSILLGIYITSVLINLGLVLSFKKHRPKSAPGGCSFALFFIMVVFPGFLTWVFLAIYSYYEAKKRAGIIVMSKEDFDALKEALDTIRTSHEK